MQDKIMSISSINIKPILATSEAHNQRKVELDYNYPNLKKNNEQFIVSSVAERRQKIEEYCKKKSGRKLQKNATPIREAVVNLNADHSIDNLKIFASELQKTFGIDCFQIYLHRDEGKSENELNHHAHMVFDWQDKKTGKMVRLNKIQMSQMQTMTARILEMERGELKVNSNRERLEPIEYKRQQEEKKIELLKEKKKELNNRIDQLESETKRLNENTKQIEGDFTHFSTTFSKQATQSSLKERNEQRERLKRLRAKLLNVLKRKEIEERRGRKGNDQGMTI